MKRFKAEWEEQGHIQIVFPHEKSDWICCLEEIRESYRQLIETISKYEPCLIICNNIKETKKYFKSFKNLHFVEIETNDTWIRDFGGIEIEENGNITTLDFTFNAWGLKFAANYDNLVTRKLFSKKIFNSSLKTLNFVLEGGSIDTNSKGSLLTNTQCLCHPNRNPEFSKKEIEKKLKEYLGVKEVIFLTKGFLEGDDTDSHIDTLARFVSEDSIAYVKCEDENDIHYKELKEMEKELQKLPFNLIPLPFPKAKFYDKERLPATYANFLFINNAVIVPTYKDPNDEKAIKIFEKLFPKRDVIGIDSTIFIRQHGSIHCATMHSFKKL